MSPLLVVSMLLAFFAILFIILDFYRPFGFRILCRLLWHDDEQVVDRERQFTYDVCARCGYVWQEDCQKKFLPGNAIYRDKDHMCPGCKKWKPGKAVYCQGSYCDKSEVKASGK